VSDQPDAIFDLINAKTKLRPLVGTFVSATSTGCTVDVGGGRMQARFGSSYLPEVNEPVNVWFIDDDTAFMMGPTVAKPSKGTVVSVAASLVTLNTDFGQIATPYIGSTPTAGQVMALRWHGGPVAMGVLSTSPPPPAPPPAPPTSTSTHQDVFTAIDAGSYNRYGWLQKQVWASDSYQGAWFYGTKVSDTVPSSASIQSVEIYLSIESMFGAAPNFALHSSATKPSGAPAYTSVQAMSPTQAWFTLPAAWGDALKAGGGQFGVGLNHGGKNVFRSLAQDGMSGALRITSTY
jgi:hypothetical protein